jgi:hypothetical protein
MEAEVATRMTKKRYVRDVFTFVFPVFLCIQIPNSKNIFHHFLQEKDKERDLHGVLFCTSRSGHDPDKLMPTQIIAGKALEGVERLVHSYRK